MSGVSYEKYGAEDWDNVNLSDYVVEIPETLTLKIF